MESDILLKYEAQAKSLLSFLCGGCHTLKSVSLFTTDTTEREVAKQVLMDKVCESAIFFESMQKYCDGVLTVEEFYSAILNTHFPSLATAEDRVAWEIFSKVLTILPDPERQTTLHLRYLQARPRMWTPCCNQEHCFRCRTRDFHNDKTCDENTACLDGSIVHCPACGIALVKGDGCDSVTCLCGRCFSWSTELRAIDTTVAFLERFPLRTSEHCVDLLCSGDRDANLFDARAWWTRHSVEINRMLLARWISTYPRCATQACVVMPTTTALSVGDQAGRDLHANSHAEEMQQCRLNNQLAITSLLVTMCPDAAMRKRLTRHLDRNHWLSKLFVGQTETPKPQWSWLDENSEAYRKREEQKRKEKEEESRFELQQAVHHLFAYGSVVSLLTGLESVFLPAVSTWSSEPVRVQCVNGLHSITSTAGLIASKCKLTVLLSASTTATSVAASPRSLVSWGLQCVTNTTTDRFTMTDSCVSSGLSDATAAAASATATWMVQELSGQAVVIKPGDQLTAVVDVEAGTCKLRLNKCQGATCLYFPAGMDVRDLQFVVTRPAEWTASILEGIDSRARLGAVSFSQAIQQDDALFVTTLYRISSSHPLVMSAMVEKLAEKWVLLHEPSLLYSSNKAAVSYNKLSVLLSELITLGERVVESPVLAMSAEDMLKLKELLPPSLTLHRSVLLAALCWKTVDYGYSSKELFSMLPFMDMDIF